MPLRTILKGLFKPSCAVVLDLTSETEAAIPNTLVQLWQPVLYLVNKLQLTTQLLDLLASHLSDVGDLRDCLSAGWISRIITAINNSGMSILLIDSSLIFTTLYN